jgi:hypothetical protein
LCSISWLEPPERLAEAETNGLFAVIPLPSPFEQAATANEKKSMAATFRRCNDIVSPPESVLDELSAR